MYQNSRAHSSSSPFEMIDKDQRQDDDSPPRTRNRSRRSRNIGSSSNGDEIVGSGSAVATGTGTRRRRLFDDFGGNSSDEDNEMLFGQPDRNNEDEFNSSGIDDDETNDDDLLRPLLTSLTVDLQYFWSQFKSVGPKLVPFFKTLGMYFVIFIPVDRPSWFAMLIKCLPVASLVLFVLLHGISMKDEHAYARRILGGLIFSCIGDALLVWPSYFVEGMTAFGIAQVLYILAFGFEAENYTLGVIIYAMTSIALGVMVPGLKIAEPALMLGVPIYVILLTTMVWRAMARVQFFDDLWSWTKLCSCFGGMCFAVSDTILGLNKFHMEIPYSQALIMVTYYLAQLGIALSVVNSKGGDPSEARREASYLEPREEDGVNRDGKRHGSVSWMEILEHTAPHTKTLELTPEEQKEAELLYY